MKKDIVTVIYDRKKTSTRRGKGKVEARIYLSRTERKYITLGITNDKRPGIGS